MNTISIILARTAVSSLAAAATAMATLTSAGAAPGDDPNLPVVLISQPITVDNCRGGGCPPKEFTFTETAPYNSVLVDLTDILPGTCGGPQWSATLDGQDLKAVGIGKVVTGPHTLVINSRCPHAGEMLTPAAWTGALLVKEVAEFAGGSASTVTAVQDGTIYDKPNGKALKDSSGHDMFLAANQSLQMQAPERCSAVKDWCRVVDSAAGAEAWIYAGLDKNGKPFVKIS